MTDKTLGAYKRTTPDPDETTGEALARLQAEMTRLLDEADAELRDEADGGVAAALIEKEAEKRDPSVDYHAMWWKAEREREKAEKERDKARAGARLAFGRCREVEAERQKVADELYSIRATDPRPLTPDAITDEMIERGAVAAWRGDVAHPDWTFEDISDEDRGWYRDNVRAVLAAALTEPPARPEGAEGIEALIEESLTGDALSDAEVRALADYLAARLLDPAIKEA